MWERQGSRAVGVGPRCIFVDGLFRGALEATPVLRYSIERLCCSTNTGCFVFCLLLLSLPFSFVQPLFASPHFFSNLVYIYVGLIIFVNRSAMQRVSAQAGQVSLHRYRHQMIPHASTRPSLCHRILSSLSNPQTRSCNVRTREYGGIQRRCKGALFLTLFCFCLRLTQTCRFSTPNFLGVIPGGQSFSIPEGTLTNVSAEGTGFTWEPSLRGGTTLILVGGDARGNGTAGSSLNVVSSGINNIGSCLSGSSPSSTPGSPAGGSYPTSTTGA